MHHSFAWLLVSAFVTAGSLGCSSGSGSGNPNGGIHQGTGNFNCQTGCNKVAAANCPDWSYGSASECAADCEQLFQSLSSQCKSLVADYESCLLSGAVTCGPDGSPGTSTMQQCQSKLNAALPCLQTSGGGSSSGGTAGGGSSGSSGGGTPAPGG